MKFYYFVDKEGVRQGPLPLEDLNAFEIEPTTLVWCKGMEKWTRAKDVKDFEQILYRKSESIKDDSGVEILSAPEYVLPAEKKSTDKTNTEISIEETSEEENDSGNNQKKPMWVITAMVIVALILFIIGFRTYLTSNTGNVLSPLPSDTIADTVTIMVDTVALDYNEEVIIQEFITNMYNNQLYNEYDFLEKHCSRHLLRVLQEDYEYDGIGYAVWDFRTSAQESKPDSSNESKIISVESIGDGWYTYEFYDGGWKGQKRIKASIVGGEVIMDVIETVYDEFTESYSNEIVKDWNLSGYMEKDNIQYPISITFHQKGEYYYSCTYKNINYGVKLSMNVTRDDSELKFEGRDGSKEFVIRVELDAYDNSWDGYATVGEQTFVTHLEE